MFGRLLLTLLVLAVVVAVVARTSSGRGAERTYIVQRADTLWSIAARMYGGDPREGVWKIQQRNHLASPLIRPGERLVLP